MSGEVSVRVEAFAKINLTLRVLGRRADGYHELRTVFQSLALHDTLTFVKRPGPFEITCTDPACPVDHTNLVWRAAELLWRAAKRRGEPADVRVEVTKRIPLQSGLGGGSSDAAASLRGLAALWRIGLDASSLRNLGRTLGADVPYFLVGGTAMGVERGDVVFQLAELPQTWLVLVLAPFGVSTREAYQWWDESPLRASGHGAPRRRGDSPSIAGLDLSSEELRNDLETAVAAHHPEIARCVTALREAGATYAAMSGSGSAVFGLFATRVRAEAAARTLGRGDRAILTRTLPRPSFRRGLRQPR